MCRFLTRGAAWAAAVVLALLVPLLAAPPEAGAAPTWRPVVDLGVASQAPVVATNSRGDAAVAYQTDSGLVARTHRVGGSWSAPTTVFSGDTYSPDVGIDARGRATVVATRVLSDSNGAVFVRSQTSSGWGSPKQVSSRASGFRVDVAVAGSGAAVIAYAEGGVLAATGGAAASDSRARAVYRAAGGRGWSAPKVLSRGDGQTVVDAVIDDRGRATVVWRRVTAESAVLESRTSNSTGAFKPVVTVASGDGIPWSWRLAGNGAGAVSVVWQWDTEPTGTGDEYVMTRTRRPARSFDAPKRLASVRTDVGRFDELDTAVAANGIVTVAWRRSDTLTVEARRRGLNRVWSATRKVASSSTPLYNLTLEPTAGNGTAVLWTVPESDIFRVSGLVLSAAGSVGTERQVMTNGHTLFTTSSSRAGDVVVGGVTREGRLWVRAMDTAGPAAKLRQPSARFTWSRKVTGAWTAADAWSAVSSYTVSRRAAKVRGGFGGTSNWTTTGSKRKSFTGVPGTTYCLKVRAKDSVGNSGASSAERCVAVPVDDRGLAASPGWAKAKSKGSYLGTVRSTPAKGRSLSVKVRTKRLALLVNRCPSCGTVDVFLGSTKLKRISLAGKAGKRVLIPVKTFGSVRSGTVRIVVVSAGKKVVIDGLATSRR